MALQQPRDFILAYKQPLGPHRRKPKVPYKRILPQCRTGTGHRYIDMLDKFKPLKRPTPDLSEPAELWVRTTDKRGNSKVTGSKDLKRSQHYPAGLLALQQDNLKGLECLEPQAKPRT